MTLACGANCIERVGGDRFSMGTSATSRAMMATFDVVLDVLHGSNRKKVLDGQQCSRPLSEALAAIVAPGENFGRRLVSLCGKSSLSPDAGQVKELVSTI
jgi:hypothetical protein